MPKSTKEFTKITALIKLIINSYPGNWAILREYLQNTDDSGALKQIFILDERSHPTGTLVDNALKGAQGPALIAINDGLVSETDWEALLKINSSSKQEDESQTGKNGLGFRASYHLTENPHILSGRTLMILDPHNEFSAHPGGVSIDLIDEADQFQDQILPFISCIEGMTFPYDGTAFRLPLRTEEQALKSDIKTTSTTVQDIREVLLEFSNQELEEAILFLKNVTSIEIYHIDSAGNKVCLSSVTIDPRPRTFTSSYTRRTTVTSAGVQRSRDWKFHCLSRSKGDAKLLMDSRLGYDIENRLTQDKLSPSLDLAFPLDASFDIRGRLFTLLPIPQYTDFPVHLNAVFALDPSRQNLKNIREVGVARSRERFLVEWNKIIFDTWTPNVWAELLVNSSPAVLVSANWKIWPPQENGEDCYWSGLTAAFTNLVVSKDLAVFPTVPGTTSPSRLVRIADPDVLLAPSNPPISLSLLSDLGIPILQPPQHIYDVLVSGNHVKRLSPENLHSLLLGKKPREHEAYDDAVLESVVEYLVFSTGSPKLKNIAGLPWFRREQDSQRVSLNAAGSGGTALFIPQTDVEASIFANSTNMLAWNTFSDKLRTQLSQPSASRILNVGVTEPSDVVSFLRRRFASLQSTSDEILNVQSDCRYAIDFWTWVIGWSKGEIFFRDHLDEISPLFLLPTSRGSLRKISSGIIHFDINDSPFIPAWNALQVYSISPEISHRIVAKLRNADIIPTPRTWKQILFLIDNTNLDTSSDLNVFDDIRTYISENLPRSLGTLTVGQKAKFKRLPIFMVKNVQTCASSLSTIDGHCIYVQVEENHPLPLLRGYPNAIYVDAKDQATLSLIRLIENKPAIQDQFSVFQLAIGNWDIQPDNAQDRFIDCIFSYRPHQLPQSLRRSLTELPFVFVNDSPQRKPPANLIHPGSVLKDLYLGEIGRMPAGRFAQANFLTVLQEFGFLRSSLDSYVVQDRISYLIDCSNAGDGLLIQKAVLFVDVLNYEWKSDYTRIVEKYRSVKWIPSNGEPTQMLFSPSESRDDYRDIDNHPYYFDQVLGWLQGRTFRSEFRAALGWSAVIPPETLIAQFTATLNAMNASNRTRRLTKLLEYLNRLLSYKNLDASALQKLRSIVNDRAWLPSTSYNEQLIETRYALLSGPSRLKAPFYPIHMDLSQSHPILRKLGCSDRPSLEVLVAELDRLYVDTSSGSAGNTSISHKFESVLAILQEIVDHHQADQLEGSGIKIPSSDGHVHPLSAVYFRDRPIDPLNIPASLREMFAAHDGISHSLAQSLGIPDLTSLLLGDEDEEEEEQMGVDFVTVVRGFLSDYDPRYAINEFLANANDARATTFSILLDERRVSPRGTLVSSQSNLRGLLSCETLFIHNDSKLKPSDLKGIRRVGRGGKQEDSDTHGRYGLGALSLYYFTDVATIISGDSVLILDPSSKYLPDLPKGGKRTAILKKISEIASLFPGQLERYESIFDFSSKRPKYEGTIFCLPLKASITEKACNLLKTVGHLQNSWRQLASRALFFTDLESITAETCTSAIQSPSTMWSFNAERSEDQHLGHDFEYQNLTIRERPTENKTNWIIATSDKEVVPDDYLKVGRVLKLTRNVKVQLAINPRDVEDKVFKGYPFSTVSLPRGTSLPFHVNARFAISSNRQDLVLNPGDSSGNKDSYTSFNTWIFETLVPPLYLEALRLLVSPSARWQDVQGPLKSKMWFFSPCSDAASKITRNAFIRMLPESNHAIFRDASGRLVSFSKAVFSKGEPKEVREYLINARMPTYIKSSQYSDIAKMDSSTNVSPAFVRKVLLENAEAILSSMTLTPVDCYAIFNYLAHESELIGLPLLVLHSDEIIAVPNASGTPVYHCGAPGHAMLFSLSQFMTSKGSYSPDLIARLLKEPSINIYSLTEHNVVYLIETQLQAGSKQHRIRWADTFWKHYHETLPGPPSIASLETAGLPLIEATLGASSSLVLLSQCRPDTVVYNTGLDSPVIDILHTLGIEIIGDKDNRHLKTFLNARFKENVLSNVLRCIFAKGIENLSSLNPASQDRISGWIQTHLQSALRLWKRDSSSMPLQKHDLLRLTIWDVYSNGAHRRGDSLNIKVLPYHLEIRHVAPYLQRNIIVAPRSSLLLDFLQLCLSRDQSSIISTPLEILSIVTLPAAVTSLTEIADMKRFLSAMFQYPDQALKLCPWSVPDRAGILRPVQDLYDESIALFRSTLRCTPRPSFIHRDFTEFKNQLRTLGLVHEITINTFTHCANAVSAAYRDYETIGWNVVMEMSRDAFTVYQNQIPALMLVQRYSSWTSIDGISFVLRRNERRQGAGYHIRENYVAGPLPSVLPPSSFVLPTYEPIVWTQRALFLEEPIDGLVTVNKTLGIPTAEEVVAHLVLLTTVIALDHPGAGTLLSDIKATYTWLNQNAESATPHLRRVESKKLFLNVDDPTDSWDGNWASSEELVLNMEYDQGPLKIPRRFLKEYEALLRAAGCVEIKTPEPKAQSSTTASDAIVLAWKTKLNNFRKADTLTDIELVPTWDRTLAETEDDDDVAFTPVSPTVDSGVDAMLDIYSYAGGAKTINRMDLRGHRVFIAAAIAHLCGQELWMQKPKADGVGEITFYGTAFAAKAVMDFVYTGEIELSVMTTDKTELGNLMRDLLEVLPVAEEWGMEDLKNRIQWEIVSKHEIVRRLPEEYDTLLSYGTKYKADQILAALKDIEHIRARIQKIRDENL